MKRNQGFTLLEILLAFAILALLAAALFSTFKQAADTITVNKENAAMYVQAKTALADISQKLQAATLSSLSSSAFFYSSDTPAYHTESIADELYCITKIDNENASPKRKSELSELGYWLKNKDPDNYYHNELKRVLVQEGSSTWDFDFSTGSSYTLAAQVVDLNFKFLEHDSATDSWQWVEEWDSRKTVLNQTANNDDNGNLPRAVKITIWVINETTALKYTGDPAAQKANAQEVTTIVHLPESRRN